MARTKNSENMSPVTGSVPAPLRAAIEDVRWEKRKTVSEIVREALEQWAQREGVTYTEDVQEDGTANGEDTAAEKVAPKPGAKASAKA